MPVPASQWKREYTGVLRRGIKGSYLTDQQTETGIRYLNGTEFKDFYDKTVKVTVEGNKKITIELIGD